MPHGKPWYAAHIEQLGYTKALIYWRGGCSEPISLSLRAKKTDGSGAQKSDHSLHQSQRFAEEMQILREIFNSGWQHTGDLCRLPNMNSRPWAINLKSGAGRYDLHR